MTTTLESPPALGETLVNFGSDIRGRMAEDRDRVRHTRVCTAISDDKVYYRIDGKPREHGCPAIVWKLWRESQCPS